MRGLEEGGHCSWNFKEEKHAEELIEETEEYEMHLASLSVPERATPSLLHPSPNTPGSPFRLCAPPSGFTPVYVGDPRGETNTVVLSWVSLLYPPYLTRRSPSAVLAEEVWGEREQLSSVPLSGSLGEFPKYFRLSVKPMG